jgi:hypothetical protein
MGTGSTGRLPLFEGRTREWRPIFHRALTRSLFFTKRHLVLVWVLGLGGVLEEFALSALKKMHLWMRSLAHAFYFLADLKGPIRSNSRAPCYFLIDPSIQPDSIAPIQF